MSKYHKGDKFIVEIKEVMNSDNGTLYRSDFKTLTFDDYGLDKLQKCETELSLDECYNKGLEDGRNEAWELAKKIVLDISRGGIPERDMRSMFGEKWTVSDVLKNYTPQEALAKLEAYEKEQNEIKVGDVVTTINGECGYIVTNIQLPNTLHCINSRNGYALQMKISSVKKTGKHIDIQSVLQQIGG